MELKIKIRWATIYGLAILLLLFVGCKKKDGSSIQGSADSQTAQVDASGFQLISETEEKQRDEFRENARSLALKKDWQNLESRVESIRSQKTRFENGSWKLRSFYSAFGEYEKIGDEKTYSDLISRLEIWAANKPASIAPKLALAEAYHGYAWLARGAGYASEVTQQGEKLMEERIKIGFKWLREAKKLQDTEKDPAFYSIVLHSFLGANVNRAVYESVFNAGVTNAPDFSAQYEYKAYYLLPRWYGQDGEWEKFAREISQRKDIPDSDEIFARIALYIRDIGYFYQEFSNDDQPWEELKSSFHAIEAKYPGSLEIKSVLCLMSAKFYDYKEARAQMKLLDGKIDLSVWKSKENFLQASQWLSQDDSTLENCRQQFKAQLHHKKN